MMVELLRPTQGMRIYDPCVGSGGMRDSPSLFSSLHDTGEFLVRGLVFSCAGCPGPLGERDIGVFALPDPIPK